MARTATIIAIIFALLIFIQCVSAQQNVSAAAVSGTVNDTNNAAVAGATVVVTNLETRQTQTATTDSRGRFNFLYLPVGSYEIRSEHSGFEPAVQKITAAVGQTFEINLVINAQVVSARVDVTDSFPTIESDRTQIAERITPRNVEELPLNGRNYVDLALLLPAVSRTNTGNVQKFAETSAVAGTGISVAGQRNLYNSFIVDGTSASDDAAELAGTYYSQEVIREFQVITSGAVAEFGRAQSGFVSIVTQSGTNYFRGKVYGFLRNDRFDARNPLAANKDRLTQGQYGGSLGGPIVKDRTFFFTNFEQTRRNDTNVITILPANVAAINGRLAQVGYRGLAIETGTVPGGYDTTNFFGRVDHQISPKELFVATYNFYDISATNARTVGGLNAVSRGTNLKNNDHTLNSQLISTFGPKYLNEFRAQYRRSRLAAPAVDNVGPAVNISGVANLGTATSSPTERDIDMFQASDGFSAMLEGHSLKFGGDFLYNKINIAFPGAVQGVYTFSNLANFLSGNYSQFQQAFGVTDQPQDNPNFGVFAQDEWRVRRRLTFNFGVRYDVQFLPDPVRTDTNNVAPRFGFAYSPMSRTVVRGSFGLYYDRLPLRAVSNALQRDGSKYIVAQIAPGSPGAPIFPNVLAAAPSTLLVKPSVTRIDPNIENSYSEQANLQIEREFPYNISASLGWIYLRGLHLIMSRNVNVPRCPSSVDANLCRPDPNFGNISRYESSGDSYYNGMVASVTKHQGKWASFRLAYTLSKSIDNSGNFFFSTPQNNYDLRDDRGLSDNDQRHRLTISGSLGPTNYSGGNLADRILNGFLFSYIYTYASALPFNVVTGNDRNGDTNINDRPVGVGRNAGRGFDYSSFDARLSRRVKVNERMNVEMLVEGFNLFNRANYSVPNNVVGTGITPLPSFRRPTAAYDPRQLQFGFRFNF
jgi:hypothetical protein